MNWKTYYASVTIQKDTNCGSVAEHIEAKHRSFLAVILDLLRFRKKARRTMMVEELECCISKAIIKQREAMHEAYFSNQPFIDWLRKEKESG